MPIKFPNLHDCLERAAQYMASPTTCRYILICSDEFTTWQLLNTASAYDIAEIFADPYANIVGELTPETIKSLLRHEDAYLLQITLVQTITSRPTPNTLIDLLTFSQDHHEHTDPIHPTHGI